MKILTEFGWWLYYEVWVRLLIYVILALYRLFGWQIEIGVLVRRQPDE